tara:strand:- start:489 stop:3209 length:2721 start_codon:yes stop_codon:yes gene_type:complete
MTLQDIGSRWYKFDFHTHTPASSDHRNPNETEIDWLKSLMQAEVDCVALTDHVSGAWVNRIKSAYAGVNSEEWFRPLHIFPGTEITVSTGQNRIHILAIFDPVTDEATITAVLGQCGIVQGQGDAEITCADKSVDEVIGIVHRANGIAIPAHIDGPKGLLHNISNCNQEIKRWLEKIEAVECINLEFLEDVNPELKTACKHLALLQGSDAHNASALGSRSTWIKMSKPTIDGLKLAIHDHTFCVDNSEENPNSIPNLFLTELYIEKMKHCGRFPGQPAIFKLHPLFNAVIGGRGSGKSTFIESIRLALGRDAEVSDLKQIHDEVESFKNGVTTPDTKIATTLKRRSETYRTVWNSTDGNNIQKLIGAEWENDLGAPKDRFHISIYSQKQINALAANSNSLLEIIDHSDSVNINQWKYDFEQEKQCYLSLMSEIRYLEDSISNAAQLHAQLSDVNSDIESFEKGGHKSVFNAYQQLAEEKQAIEESGNIETLSTNISSLISAKIPSLNLPLTDDGEVPSHLLEVVSIHDEYLTGIAKVKAAALKLQADLENLVSTRKAAIDKSEWANNAAAVEGNYQSVVAEYKEKGEEFNPEQYDLWLKTRNNINEKLGKVENFKSERDSKKIEAQRSFRRLYRLRRELQSARSKFIDDVVGENKYVRMKLIPFANTKNIENQFRGVISIDSGFSSSIYQDNQENSLLYKLIHLPSDAILRGRVNSIEGLKKSVNSLSEGVTPEGVRADRRLLTSLEEKRTHQPEIFDRLLTWWPDDLLVVEYAKDLDRGRFENIEKGSAGQKAAAILAFLLSHGDNPIIVDQPEDDLDNALIYQLIVSQIHENKKHRQIIMVTHNPNIVVNGDAEYVNILHYHGGQIQILDAGGLCEPSIREHVCEIMEGGTTAFERRYQRLRVI